MALKKKQIFKILSLASLEEVKEISNDLYKNYQIKIIKPAHKTLVMVKVREAVNRSLFYIGEVLVCECMVEINDTKGVSVTAGDDFEKTTNIAAIDAALNANVIEKESILEKIYSLYEKQLENRSRLNGQIMKSKVTFNVMNQE